MGRRQKADRRCATRLRTMGWWTENVGQGLRALPRMAFAIRLWEAGIHSGNTEQLTPNLRTRAISGDMLSPDLRCGAFTPVCISALVPRAAARPPALPEGMATQPSVVSGQWSVGRRQKAKGRSEVRNHALGVRHNGMVDGKRSARPSSARMSRRYGCCGREQ